jgi:hypothetical protein
MRNRTAVCMNAGSADADSACGVLATALMLPSNTLGCWNAGWHTSAWTECSAQCAGGTMTRTAVCVDTHGATVPEKFCPSPRPVVRQECNTRTCYDPNAEPASWFFRRRLQQSDEAADHDSPAWLPFNLRSALRASGLGSPAALQTAAGKSALLPHRSLQQAATPELLTRDIDSPDAVGAPYFHSSCSEMTCSQHGTCRSGYCACEEGYSGNRCHLHADCTGFVQAEGSCCASGHATALLPSEDVDGRECCERVRRVCVATAWSQTFCTSAVPGCWMRRAFAASPQRSMTVACVTGITLLARSTWSWTSHSPRTRRRCPFSRPKWTLTSGVLPSACCHFLRAVQPCAVRETSSRTVQGCR